MTMAANIEPYPADNSFNVEKGGEAPAHWKKCRLKDVAWLNPGRTEARALLEADTSVVFIPMERVGEDGNIDECLVPATMVYNGYTCFRRDDVLVAKITPCFENGKGACLDSLSTEIGFGSTEFHVLRAKQFVLPRFLYYMTILPEFRQLGKNAMIGAAGQQRVPQEFVSNYPILLPTLTEQDAVVCYLDDTEQRIRRYINVKQKLIGLLKEQWQAVIDRAITRGLDPNVRTKPSRIGWIGDVPVHWERRRLKTTLQPIDKRSITGRETLLSLRRDHGVVAYADHFSRPAQGRSLIGYKQVEVGQLVVNRLQANNGLVFCTNPQRSPHVLHKEYSLIY